MKLNVFAGTWLVTLLVFLALDATWLSLMLDRLYRPALAHLLAPRVDWRPVALFYLLYTAGIGALAVVPAKRATAAAARGAALGLLAYATYDLSNQATLPGWPWQVTLVDLAWGATATAIAAWIAAIALRALWERA